MTDIPTGQPGPSSIVLVTEKDIKDLAESLDRLDLPPAQRFLTFAIVAMAARVFTAGQSKPPPFDEEAIKDLAARLNEIQLPTALQDLLSAVVDLAARMVKVDSPQDPPSFYDQFQTAFEPDTANYIISLTLPHIG